MLHLSKLLASLSTLRRSFIHRPVSLLAKVLTGQVSFLQEGQALNLQPFFCWQPGAWIFWDGCSGLCITEKQGTCLPFSELVWNVSFKALFCCMMDFSFQFLT